MIYVWSVKVGELSSLNSNYFCDQKPLKLRDNGDSAMIAMAKALIGKLYYPNDYCETVRGIPKMSWYSRNIPELAKGLVISERKRIQYGKAITELSNGFGRIIISAP